MLGAAIVNAARMGATRWPWGRGSRAVARVALLASVRQHRRQLSLLKVLGLTRCQMRQAVAWHASVTLLAAAILGCRPGSGRPRVWTFRCLP